MELLALFDDENRVLNKSIPRSNKFDVKDGEYFKIILLFIINSKNQYLIQKSSNENKYATTGGHVTYGDDDIITTIKEAREELGLTLIKSNFKKFETIKTPKAFVECFYMQRDIPLDSLKLQEEEVESVSYLTVNEIKKLMEEGLFNCIHYEAFIDLEEKRKNNDL